jgi:O-antigen biosynthesis protein WbqV
MATFEGLIAGSARAVKASAGVPGVVGAVVIGEGAAPADVRAKFPTWESLDFAQLQGSALLLAEKPSVAVLRALLRRAAASGVRLYLLNESAPRLLELEDVFDRPLRKLDWTRIQDAISGKRVLITGGGGSIGSQLARRIAALGPARLALLDSSEFNLFKIAMELPHATPVLADIRDEAAVRRWITAEKPDIVFHAAALKQVPIVELFASEGVLTNICGLRHVVEAAHANNADVIFLSTDKAVAPSGVMGATKRLGELYCHALDRLGGRRAVPVRLGNVLGSSGSVVPVFESQIAAGGPLTVTDPAVTRYFMSIPQAAKALMQACAAGLSADHQRGVVFTIDMGDPLPVVDLARIMIQLEGLEPDKDVDIVITGLRPGEKLHEQLLGADEWIEPSPAPDVIAAASAPRGVAELREIMDRLALLARTGAQDEIVKELFAAIAAEPIAREQAEVG